MKNEKCHVFSYYENKMAIQIVEMKMEALQTKSHEQRIEPSKEKVRVSDEKPPTGIYVCMCVYIDLSKHVLSI